MWAGKIEKINKRKVLYVGLGLLLLGWILSVLRWEMPKKPTDFTPGKVIVALRDDVDIGRIQEYIKTIDSGLDIKETYTSSFNSAIMVLVDYEKVWRPKMSQYFRAEDRSLPEIQALGSELRAKKIEMLDISRRIEDLPYVKRVATKVRTDINEDVPRITVYFMDKEVDSYVEQITLKFPQLEVVHKYQEKLRVVVRVPEGTEEEWVAKFGALDYVEWADLEHIARSFD